MARKSQGGTPATVTAGKRGLQVELAPLDLVELTEAELTRLRLPVS